VEKRGVKYHRGRLGEALREEIETLVEGELGDPRIGLVAARHKFWWMWMTTTWKRIEASKA